MRCKSKSQPKNIGYFAAKAVAAFLIVAAVSMLVFGASLADENNVGADSENSDYEAFVSEVTLDASLFEDPASEYKTELAILSSQICVAASSLEDAGITAEYEGLGIDAGDIYTGNYGGKSLAYSIAAAKLSSEGEDTDLLIINCRGSRTTYEFVEDAASGVTQAFDGYTTWSVIWDFYNGVKEGLNEFLESHEYLKDAQDLKLLICGHSLGGACANLLGAYYTKEARDGNSGDGLLLKGDDIYVYTFGAINSIKTDAPVSEGFENIHNIYNKFDTFGPMRLGNVLPSGVGTMYGKFGHMDVFEAIYEKEEFSGFSGVASELDYAMHHAENHLIANYADAVGKGLVACSRITDADAVTRVMISGGCSAKFYEGAELKGEAIEGEVSADAEIPLYEYDGKICAYLEGGGEKSVIIEATEEGTIGAEIEDRLDDTQESITFEGVQANSGELFSLEIEFHDGVLYAEMFKINENLEMTHIVARDGTLTKYVSPEKRQQIIIIIIAAGFAAFFASAGALIIVAHKRRKEKRARRDKKERGKRFGKDSF